MNLSDQNSGSLKKQGAHTEGGLENVYPPVAGSGRTRDADGDVALADLALSDAMTGEPTQPPHDARGHSLHASSDGPAPGHREHDTQTLTGGTPIPTLDIDVATMGESAFPLDGQGPGQGETTRAGESDIAIDLPLDATPAVATTLQPDQSPDALQPLDEQPLAPAAVDDDDTGIPLIGRRSVGYQQRVLGSLIVFSLHNE